MSQIAIKFSGMQGQGINSLGETCATAFKRKGVCVFGYREYMSLIKGGHSSYQLDFASDAIQSSKEHVDIMACMDYYGLKQDLHCVKEGGILIYRTPEWKFSPEDEKMLKRKKVKVIYLNLEKVLKEMKAIPILGNVVVAAFVWQILGQDVSELKKMLKKQLGERKKHLIPLNMQCVDKGVELKKELAPDVHIPFPKTKPVWKNQLLITGSQAMGLGAIHGGCRMYVGYPMTPASPLLTYISSLQNKSQMVIKQAEDEITAAQMVSGAFFMGCRALTATAGGGIDLMSETISVNGIAENPCVLVLAQRSGAGTGIPTWTGQGDLFLAVNAGHGELPRCVISVSDSQDAFDLMPVAFNIAEVYQMPVIVMTDKHIAEGLYTQKPYDHSKAKIERGIVTSASQLAKLTSMDRYDPHAKNGISPRWLPGAKAATYCAQGDEHMGDGAVDETAQNAIEQIDKRMKKMDVCKKKLPEPELFGHKQPDYLLVGFGSTKGAVLDALRDPKLKNKKIGYLHYTYMWPLKTGRLEQLRKKAKKVINVEGNYQGQLGMLLGKAACIPMDDTIVKYDGRPFFQDELVTLLSKKLS